MKWIDINERLPDPPPDDRVCGKGSPVENTILIFRPSCHSDPDYPGHSVSVSNREYVTKNGKASGITHWAEIPEPPY